jgi:hypothetical protein
MVEASADLSEEGQDCFGSYAFAAKHFTAALDVFSNIDNIVRIGPLDIVMRQLPKLSAEDWKAIDKWRRRHKRRG